MIKFILIINKLGRLRLGHYFEHRNADDKRIVEADIIRKCLSATEKQCTFWEYRDFTVVHRKYVNLYFIAGITGNENELAVVELMHNLLETLNVYFGKVSELDIIYNVDKVHLIIQEMLLNGYVMETVKRKALAPLQLLEATKK